MGVQRGRRRRDERHVLVGGGIRPRATGNSRVRGDGDRRGGPRRRRAASPRGCSPSTPAYIITSTCSCPQAPDGCGRSSGPSVRRRLAAQAVPVRYRGAVPSSHRVAPARRSRDGPSPRQPGGGGPARRTAIRDASGDTSAAAPITSGLGGDARRRPVIQARRDIFGTCSTIRFRDAPHADRPGGALPPLPIPGGSVSTTAGEPLGHSSSSTWRPASASCTPRRVPQRVLPILHGEAIITISYEGDARPNVNPPSRPPSAATSSSTARCCGRQGGSQARSPTPRPKRGVRLLKTFGPRDSRSTTIRRRVRRPPQRAIPTTRAGGIPAAAQPAAVAAPAAGAALTPSARASRARASAWSGRMARKLGSPSRAPCACPSPPAPPTDRVGPRHLEVQRQRRARLRLRLRETSLRQHHAAERGACGQRVRLETERLTVDALGVREPALLREHLAEVAVGADIVTLELDGRRERRFRLVVAPCQ